MWPGVVITGVLGLLLSIFPESGKATVDFLFAGITQNFKWVFLLFGIFFVIVLIWLASSRWGSIKLDEIEFSTYSWAAMIFYAPFFGNTINSAAYTFSCQVTSELAGDQEPPRWNRTLSGLLLALLALELFSIGALKAVALASLTVALPLIPVFILMMF